MSDNNEDFEYCGDCPVCNKPVDHSDAGFCGKCGSAFHWGDCGTWGGSEHICNKCDESLNCKDCSYCDEVSGDSEYPSNPIYICTDRPNMSNLKHFPFKSKLECHSFN
jgi:hypothetical protein